MSTPDRIAVLRGGAFALLLATPAALVNTWLAEQDPKPAGALNLTLLVMLVGFLVGGFVSGRESTEDRARGGAAAGLIAFVPVQLIGLIGRTGRGDPISLGSILFLLLLAATTGTLGALLAIRLSRRQP